MSRAETATKEPAGDGQGAFTYASLPILFPFLGGQFCFRCDGCDARCCHEASTLTVATNQSELVHRLGGAASVNFAGEGYAIVQIGRGGCPALRPDRLCALHVEGGRRAKPALCALFPFTRLHRTDSFIVVAPAIGFVCPLSIDPQPRHSSPCHREIVEDLEHFFEGRLAPFAPLDLPDRDAVTLAGELAFRDIANAQRGQRTVIEVVAEAAGRQVGSIEEEIAHAEQLIEQPFPPDSADLSAVMLPLLPTLRINFYRAPRRAIDTILAIAARLVSGVAAISHQPLSPRRIASLVSGRARLLTLLARAGEPVSLGAAPKLPAVGDAEVLLEAKGILSAIERHPGSETLATWIARAGQVQGQRRWLLLRALAENKLGYSADRAP